MKSDNNDDSAFFVYENNDEEDVKLILPATSATLSNKRCSSQKQSQKRSPYLASSIWFALSSLVYAITALQVCLKSGFTSENIQSLVASTLYVIAYVSYARAEWQPLQKSILPTLASPATLQRF